MAAIPGWVYIIIGIIMILASWFIKNNDGSRSLIIFLYVGSLFIIIGSGKYVFKAVFKKRKTKPAMPEQHAQPAQHTHHTAHRVTHPRHQHLQTRQISPPAHHRLTSTQGQHEVHRAGVQQHPQHLSIITCPVCGTKHYSYADYCMKCGAKIKK